jgi:kinetochore protein Spc24, fungi type
LARKGRDENIECDVWKINFNSASYEKHRKTAIELLQYLTHSIPIVNITISSNHRRCSSTKIPRRYIDEFPPPSKLQLTSPPSQLISHTISNFSLHADKSALSRISTTLSTLSQSRSQRRSTSQSHLNSLNRKLQSLANNHSSLVNEHDGSGHAELIMELDAQKFRIAKGARDAEEEGERLGGELETLKGRLEKLDAEGPEGGARRGGGRMEDATLLVLSS